MPAIALTEVIRSAIAKAITQVSENAGKHLQVNVQPCYLKYNAHYTSAVAFALASHLGKTGLETAEILCNITQGQAAENFTVSVGGVGLLNFVLTNAWFVELLTDLHTWQPTEVSLNSSPPNFASYSYLQYFHARCCALLRLAKREGLITDVDIFTCEFCDRQGKLLLQETPEQKLALWQLTVGDSLNFLPNLSVQQRIKLCQQLTAQFDVFYQQCRLFGVELEIAQVRFGLVALTRKLITALVGELIHLPQDL